jgi:hypothetical protein
MLRLDTAGSVAIGDTNNLESISQFAGIEMDSPSADGA